MGRGAACVTTTGALKRPWLSVTCWDSELPFGATAGLECVEMAWCHSFNCRMPSSVFPSLVFLFISVTNFHLFECIGFTVFL